MFKIEEMKVGTEFRIICKEHKAILRCSSKELKLIDKRTFAYKCPICGRKHEVSAFLVEQVNVVDTNVPLDRKDLPINKKKKSKKELKALMKRVKILEEALAQQLTVSEAESATEMVEQKYPNDTTIIPTYE